MGSQLQAEAEAESFADAEADAEWGFVKNIVRSVAKPFIPAQVVVRPPPPPKPHAVGGELEGFAFQNGNCQRKLCQNWSDGQQRCKAPTVVDIGICCGEKGIQAACVEGKRRACATAHPSIKKFMG